MGSLGAVADLDQRLLASELSSDSTIDTTWASPCGGQLSWVILVFVFGEAFLALDSLLDSSERGDCHL